MNLTLERRWKLWCFFYMCVPYTIVLIGTKQMTCFKQLISYFDVLVRQMMIEPGLDIWECLSLIHGRDVKGNISFCLLLSDCLSRHVFCLFVSPVSSFIFPYFLSFSLFFLYIYIFLSDSFFRLSPSLAICFLFLFLCFFPSPWRWPIIPI